MRLAGTLSSIQRSRRRLCSTRSSGGSTWSCTAVSTHESRHQKGLTSLGSKYFGGHSDLLNGTLVVKTEQEWYQVR
jgi:hypothetical protein